MDLSFEISLEKEALRNFGIYFGDLDLGSPGVLLLLDLSATASLSAMMSWPTSVSTEETLLRGLVRQ